MSLSKNQSCRLVLKAQVLKKRLRRSIIPRVPYPFALNISASSRASPSQMTFSISVSSSSARRSCVSVSLTHITFSVKRLTLSRMMRMDFLGSLIVLDAAERECDIRLPGSLIGGIVGRKIAGAPRHHIRIQRFGNKEATTVAACSRASLVADIMDAVNIEADAQLSFAPERNEPFYRKSSGADFERRNSGCERAENRTKLSRKTLFRDF